MSTSTQQVAPQFIENLQDQAEEYLVSQLQAIHAPAELIELVRCTSILAAYQTHQAATPNTPFIGIEDITIQTINLLYKGGAA